MLDTIRKRKGNFIVTFIILLIVLVMGVYGVGELAESNNPSEIAWVNGEPITAKDYQNRMAMMLDRYRAMFGDQMDERLLQNALLRKQALDSLVDSRLFAQNAKRMGFQVADNELADFIHKQPYFQKNGSSTTNPTKRSRTGVWKSAECAKTCAWAGSWITCKRACS